MLKKSFLLFSTLFFVGCGGANTTSSTSLTNAYYKPTLATIWQYQLTNDLNTSTNATLYDIDLEDTSSEVIENLHKNALHVICYFSAGSAEAWRSDFGKFQANDMGKKLDNWDGEYWLDIRSQNVKNIMLKRLDRAKAKGCDGVEADNVDGYDNDTGLDFNASEQLTYNRFLAQEAHKRGLSIGLKNDLSQVNALVNDFDFAVNEQCFAQKECKLLTPFIKQKKPVFNVEYKKKYKTNDTMTQLCNKAKNLGFSTNILSRNLDGSMRYNCSNYLFESYGIGVGGADAFKFHHNKYLNIYDIINNDYTRYDKTITDFNVTAFNHISSYLKHTKYVVFWLTQSWKENWFNVTSIQKLIDQGKTPVFIYWYFGDKLQKKGYLDSHKQKYMQDVIRMATFLKKFHGDKLLLLEPEFNKNDILDDEQERKLFVEIMQEAIDKVKSIATRAYISLTMMDTGSRTTLSDLGKCGYSSCALGDKYEWSRVDSIYKPLVDKLDFLSFNEMLSQFSRDPQNAGGWYNPNPIVYSDEEIGIDYLPQRIDNFAKFLKKKYHKPVFLPYMAIATATWEDINKNNTIENDEINVTGWEQKAQEVYSKINTKSLFGLSVMELFDNPAHDDGGYQFFMQNEYHLGIIKGAIIDKELTGAIKEKAHILSTLFKKEDK